MKAIIIENFLKFQRQEHLPKFEYLYKNGYWNILKYNEKLEQYLIQADIRFTVKEEEDISFPMPIPVQ